MRPIRRAWAHHPQVLPGLGPEPLALGVLEHQLAPRGDDAARIVDLVGQARRQGPEAGQLLGLAERLFQGDLGRQVLDQDDEAPERPVGAADRAPLHAENGNVFAGRLVPDPIQHEPVGASGIDGQGPRPPPVARPGGREGRRPACGRTPPRW